MSIYLGHQERGKSGLPQGLSDRDLRMAQPVIEQAADQADFDLSSLSSEKTQWLVISVVVLLNLGLSIVALAPQVAEYIRQIAEAA